MATGSSNFVEIATIYFEPFASADVPSQCSLVQAYSSIVGLKSFKQPQQTKLKHQIDTYLDQFQTKHEDISPASPIDLTTPSISESSQCQASPATKVFMYLMTFTRKFHPLVFKLHPKDPPSKPHPSFSISLPMSHILGTPQNPGAPRELVKGNRILRAVLWHAVRQTKNTGTVPVQSTSLCGIVGCDGACCPQFDSEDRLKFHLDKVYEQQTAENRARRISLKSSKAHPLPVEQRTSALLSLPEELLLRIAWSLPPTDLARLSACNPYLENMLLHVVPGLRLKLFPHQVHALKRMNSMEALTVRDTPMPLLTPIKIPNSETGCCLAIDLVDGSILFLDGIPYVGPPSGGLFCDEPGLGKTVTAIALILKTMGRFARPPSGKQVYKEAVYDNEVEWEDMSTKEIQGSEGVSHENHIFNASTDSGVDDVCTTVPYFIERPVPRFRACGEENRTIYSRKSKLLEDPFGRMCAPRRSVQHTNFLGRGQSLGVPSADTQEIRVYLSPATLVVVPTVLTSHWTYQLSKVVEKGRLRILHIQNRFGVYESARDLAVNYDVVIASFDVIRNMYETMRDTAPPLMRVHFRRIIVDEGHSLSSPNSFANFVVCVGRLRGECRWVMTGTPTPSTPHSDVDHLFELLSFIREEGYGLDKDAWRAGVSEPYSNFKRESLERLGALLSRVMIRADKSILPTKCHIKDVILEFSDTSAKSYNGIVQIVHRNLLLCDWFSDAHKESLINPANHHHAGLVFQNLRLACCAGGSAFVEFFTKDVVETLDILYEKYRKIAGIKTTDRFRDPTFDTAILDACNADDPELQIKKERVIHCQKLHHALLERGEGFTRLPRFIKDPNSPGKYEKAIYAGRLHQIAESLFGGSTICQRCSRQTTTPIITMCGHMLCDDCIMTDKTKCPMPKCGHAYYMDRKGVPEDLIELQPSASAEEWVSDWENTKSTKIDYLIDRILGLPDIEEWEDGKYEPTKRRPKVIVHSEYPEHLKYVAVKFKQNEKLEKSFIEMTRNEMELTNRIRNRRASDVAIMSLEKFKSYETDDDGYTANILLMNTKHGAVGLDLSFVQYIFLLEPVWDRASELQVISRAHRIGCKHDIFVERLVMRNSVEHGMLIESKQRSGSNSMNHGGEKFRTAELRVTGVAEDKKLQDQKRRAYLLRTLKTVKGISELNQADVGATKDSVDAATDSCAEEHDDLSDISVKEEQVPEILVKEEQVSEISVKEEQIPDDSVKEEDLPDISPRKPSLPETGSTMKRRGPDGNEGKRQKKRVCFQLDT